MLGDDEAGWRYSRPGKKKGGGGRRDATNGIATTAKKGGERSDQWAEIWHVERRKKEGGTAVEKGRWGEPFILLAS